MYKLPGMDDGVALWTTYATIVVAIFGAAAFVWKVIDFIVSRKGAMVPRLECHSEHSNNKYYIVASTSLENTGRKSICLKIAYLLLLYPSSIGHDEGIKKIYEEIVGPKLGEGVIAPAKYTELYKKCKENDKRLNFSARSYVITNADYCC